MSRVQDGICDCCDGSDEAEGLCGDICEQVLKEEREARAKLEKDFSVGHNKRKHDLFAFKKLREEKLKAVGEMEQKLESVQTKEIDSQIDTLKQNYMATRMATAEDLARMNAEILQGLDTKELKEFIVHSCQLAGEMSDENTKVCIALRLAGLDMGITWNDDNFDIEQIKVTEDISQDLAILLVDNAISTSSMWTLGKDAKNRRRLDDFGDDDYHGDYDGYNDYDGYGDDDFYGDDDDTQTNENRRSDGDKHGKEKEMIDEVQEMSFSKTRMAFLARSKEIDEEISKILDGDSDKVQNDETAVGQEIKPPIDPAAYTMVRSKLKRKDKAIRKGFEWAASALLFVRASPEVFETNQKLLRLAIGTLYHGNLSAIHVWQIMQAVIPELPKPEILLDSCASPWAGFCPPQTISRSGFDIPMKSIFEAADAFCSQQAGTVEGACAAESEIIPVSIPEGYYGYSPAVPREDDDLLSAVFAPMASVTVDEDALNALKKQLNDKENEKKELKRSIEDTWQEIGGRDGDDFGPNGELHSLADKCFDVQAGKYTYEVCIFGKAKQKEGKDGGTSLGSWSKMETNADTGERILYWKNGQKCWNGPKRSATVHMTCGAETKVLSADEPDTCRYLLTMESHIACDDAFRKHNDL